MTDQQLHSRHFSTCLATLFFKLLGVGGNREEGIYPQFQEVCESVFNFLLVLPLLSLFKKASSITKSHKDKLALRAYLKSQNHRIRNVEIGAILPHVRTLTYLSTLGYRQYNLLQKDPITASSTPTQPFVQNISNLQLFVYIHSTFWPDLYLWGSDPSIYP